VLVAVNAEGFCHIIAAPSDTVPFLTPACSFEIPRNCSAILIADIGTSDPRRASRYAAV